MNLIYVCVFHKESYVNLLELLMNSISVKSNIQKNTDILIVTSSEFQPIVASKMSAFDLPIHYYILNLHTLFEAGCARLNIFQYEHVNKYDRILYLDTDILINGDLTILFNRDISSDMIYALEEGTLHCKKYGTHWGSQFFDLTKVDPQQTAFTSGILLFRRSATIQALFATIQSHIAEYVRGNNPIPLCLDQPFIVFHAISQNKYDNQLLKAYAENNPYGVHPNKLIYHFPGGKGPGDYTSKHQKMTLFWKKMITKYAYEENTF